MPDPLEGDVRPSGPGEVHTRKEFGRALTVLRKRAGLAVREAAKKVGQDTHTTMGDWFAGRTLPSVSSRDLFVKVLRVCGVYDDESINEWLLALDRIRRPPGPRPGGLEPYRGLEPFQPEHADWFFGREALTKELVEGLTALYAAGGGVQMVVGASGSGKSSLLRAGVIPAFRENRSAGAAEWQVELFTPRARPVKELAKTLASMIDIPNAEVTEALRRDPMLCAEYVRRACVAEVGGNVGGDPAAKDAAQHEAETAHQRGLVIVVDQFEEAFTACDDEDERQRFVEALCAAATNPGGAVVVIGLRADFYAQVLQHDQLLTAVRDGQFIVGPMNEVGLRDAIVEPARKARIEIEDGLVELLCTPTRSRSATRCCSPLGRSCEPGWTPTEPD